MYEVALNFGNKSLEKSRAQELNIWNRIFQDSPYINDISNIACNFIHYIITTLTSYYL